MTSTAMANTIDHFSLDQFNDDSEASITAFLGAIGTFSYGYSDGVNPLSLGALLVGSPLVAALLAPQSDQWVGLKLLFSTIQKSESIDDKVVDFSELAFEDFVDYLNDISNVLTIESLEGAISNLFTDTKIGTSGDDQ